MPPMPTYTCRHLDCDEIATTIARFPATAGSHDCCEGHDCKDMDHYVDRPSEEDIERYLESCRAEILHYQNLITTTVGELCPVVHMPLQHRDGKAPWCPHCGRDRLGNKIATPR